MLLLILSPFPRLEKVCVYSNTSYVAINHYITKENVCLWNYSNTSYVAINQNIDVMNGVKN